LLERGDVGLMWTGNVAEDWGDRKNCQR
jgi:hypothetical protein